MNIRKFAHREYKRYCLADGSQHIISEFALNHILKLIRNYEIKNILEVGVGIGTISGSISKYARLENLSIKVSGTEANSFCLDQIPINLGGDYEKLNLFKEVKNLPEDEFYDLVIIDGGEENLVRIKDKLYPGGIVVIEGDRANQVKVIREIFSQSKYVQLISLQRNGEYSVKNPIHYQGGLKIVFTAPDLRQLIHWVKLKTVTKIKFLRRKYFDE